MRSACVAVLLAFGGAGCGKTDSAPDASRVRVVTYEPPPPWLPKEGPPAGRDPCAREGSPNAEAATHDCFAKRIKPALLALAKTRRLEELDVGERAHMEDRLMYTPHVGCSVSAVQGESRNDEPKRVVLGDPARVLTTRRYFRCALSAGPGTPPDTGYYLDFYIEEQSLESVYVVRANCC